MKLNELMSMLKEWYYVIAFPAYMFFIMPLLIGAFFICAMIAPIIANLMLEQNNITTQYVIGADLYRYGMQFAFLVLPIAITYPILVLLPTVFNRIFKKQKFDVDALFKKFIDTMKKASIIIAYAIALPLCLLAGIVFEVTSNQSINVVWIAYAILVLPMLFKIIESIYDLVKVDGIEIVRFMSPIKI